MYDKKAQDKYRKTHRKERNEYSRKYHSEHKEREKLYRAKYYKKNREKSLERSKIYQLKHILEIKKYRKEYGKNYRLTHKIELKERKKLWHQKNKKNIKIERKNRFLNDLHFKLSHYLRTRIVRALRGNPKLSTAMNLVGCSIKQLKQHLEKQFKQGMSWDSYGKWHIDHIKPCASFDLSKKSEQCRCFHYTNLQPLWAKDNLEKGNKFSEDKLKGGKNE